MPRPQYRPQGVAEAIVADGARAAGRSGVAVFGWVLRDARHRVRDRENLRFESAALFGRPPRVRGGGERSTRNGCWTTRVTSST